MKRIVMLAVIAAAVLALAAGTALAVTKNAGPGDDTVRGTNQPDTLRGETGDDTLFGLRGADLLSGGTGDDEIYAGQGRDDVFGGTGSDFINDGNDGVRDDIDCGLGTDTVIADPIDDLTDCENVTRR